MQISSWENAKVLQENANIFARERKSFARENKIFKKYFFLPARIFSTTMSLKGLRSIHLFVFFLNKQLLLFIIIYMYIIINKIIKIFFFK